MITFFVHGVIKSFYVSTHKNAELDMKLILGEFVAFF